ncbi:hypothetical protein RHSIM_Rhsim13G0121700 [Rhododendron simsii]|uniref:Arginosuccinate synthase-like N-terminal domain-containing protein n=1 Tax=Rhododendron simsii TaxID=118357 RepID=A0A834G005_RHOSS|nr:hypothetical protein RHSIM_Rhsim13G0121700 [Rhododendron simsii]
MAPTTSFCESSADVVLLNPKQRPTLAAAEDLDDDWVVPLEKVNVIENNAAVSNFYDFESFKTTTPPEFLSVLTSTCEYSKELMMRDEQVANLTVRRRHSTILEVVLYELKSIFQSVEVDIKAEIVLTSDDLELIKTLVVKEPTLPAKPCREISKLPSSDLSASFPLHVFRCKSAFVFSSCDLCTISLSPPPLEMAYAAARLVVPFQPLDSDTLTNKDAVILPSVMEAPNLRSGQTLSPMYLPYFSWAIWVQRLGEGFLSFNFMGHPLLRLAKWVSLSIVLPLGAACIGFCLLGICSLKVSTGQQGYRNGQRIASTWGSIKPESRTEHPKEAWNKGSLENYCCEVVCFTADVGQGTIELEGLEKKAKASGASQLVVKDLKEEFVRDYISRCLRAGAVYGRKYLLGTSMACDVIAKASTRNKMKLKSDMSKKHEAKFSHLKNNPLCGLALLSMITQAMVDVAREVGADAVSHGCTGKGNDQVHLLVINSYLGREDAIEYAKKHNVPVPVTHMKCDCPAPSHFQLDLFLAALYGVHKEQNSPIEEVVQSGGVLHFVEFLVTTPRSLHVESESGEAYGYVKRRLVKKARRVDSFDVEAMEVAGSHSHHSKHSMEKRTLAQIKKKEKVHSGGDKGFWAVDLGGAMCLFTAMYVGRLPLLMSVSWVVYSSLVFIARLHVCLYGELSFAASGEAQIVGKKDESKYARLSSYCGDKSAYSSMWNLERDLRLSDAFAGPDVLDFSAETCDGGTLVDSYISRKIVQHKEQVTTLKKCDERYKTVFLQIFSVLKGML